MGMSYGSMDVAMDLPVIVVSDRRCNLSGTAIRVQLI